MPGHLLRRARIGQGAKGLQKHGVPANSGAVHGARYNARVLAGHIARTRFGIEPERPRSIAPDAVGWLRRPSSPRRPSSSTSAATSRGVLTADPAGGLRDDGVQPLAHVLDAGGPDAVAVTLEADGSGAIYPVVLHPERRHGRRADDRRRTRW